jgi:hypothetical protein
LANSKASALPIPDDAPVMSAVLRSVVGNAVKNIPQS